jgi:hypothetical protein
MSETKHTPGPWTPENNVAAKGIMHFSITARHADPDYFVCSITPMSLKRPQDEANASLISAAPELLEACKKILTKDWGEALDAMPALIAKAEGGESC